MMRGLVGYVVIGGLIGCGCVVLCYPAAADSSGDSLITRARWRVRMWYGSSRKDLAASEPFLGAGNTVLGGSTGRPSRGGEGRGGERGGLGW